MNSIKGFLSCRCHARYAQFELDAEERPRPAAGKAPAHTFSWAKSQYLGDRPVWPTYQSLDLVLDINKKDLSGTNTIKFKVVAKEVKTFKVDSVDLGIHSVSVDNKPAAFTVSEAFIEVQLPEKMIRGQTGEIKISYTCHDPKAGIYFIMPDDAYPDRPVQVWTQGQDDDSRYWFPSFDEPRIKCPCELKVEVPAGFIATSNGALVAESRGGQTWTFYWKTGFSIPSYLVTLTVGKFAEIKEDWRSKPVVYLVEKGREAEGKLSFGKTPKMLDVFSKTLGVDYPYEKYTQVAVAEFVFGGMENTSATTQTDATLHPAEVTEDFTSDDLVSHELGHQWFGDLVTCKSWAHGWLNEGWATFLETVFKEQDLGAEETEYYRLEEFQIYQNEDSHLYRRPIVSNIYSDPGEIWDRHIYQKGGLVLNMLRNELGAEDFWAGTKHYLNTHRGGVVETIDFQRALESVAHCSLQEFFDQWIYKGGYPELKFSFDWDEKSKLATVRIQQKQKTSEITPIFSFRNSVEFVFGDKSSKSFPVLISEESQNFVFHLREKPSYCRFDVGNNLIKTLDWALPLDMIKNQLRDDTDVVSKVWAMKHIEKEAPKDGVEAVIDRLKSDSFWGVRAEAATSLGEIKSAQALSGLLACLKEETKSKVRAKICAALGNYKEAAAVDALLDSLGSDRSVFVRAAAAAALGRTKSAKAFDALKDSLKIKTWNDVLANHAYIGLRHLRDDRAIPLFLEGARYGAPKLARISAILSLGEYALNKPEITEFLEDRLRDPYHRARFAAADALVKRKDPKAVSSLEETGNRVVDGHLKAAAFRAVRRLRANLEKPEELKELRESVERLADENRKLRDRLTKLESTAK